MVLGMSELILVVRQLTAVTKAQEKIAEQNKVIIEMPANQAAEMARHARTLADHSRYLVDHERALADCRRCRNFEPQNLHDHPTGETSGPFPALKGPVPGGPHAH